MMEEITMKKFRKLLASVLAMLMAFSLMSVAVAAYNDGHEDSCAVHNEEIQPRRPAKICVSCQVEMTYVPEGARYKFVCPRCGVETGWMPVKQTCSSCQIAMTYIEIGPSGNRQYYFECPKCHMTTAPLPV